MQRQTPLAVFLGAALLQAPLVAGAIGFRANATWSYTFPGLSPPLIDGFGPSQAQANATWNVTGYTIETSDFRLENGTRASSTETLYTLTSNPSYLLASQNLSYSGCAHLIRLPARTIANGQDDDGSCSTALGSACQAALLKQAAAYALGKSGTNSPQTCVSSFGGVLPADCNNALQNVTGFYYNPHVINPTSGHGNNLYNQSLTSSNATTGVDESQSFGFFSTGKTYALNDYSGYDAIVTNIVPIIFTGWLTDLAAPANNSASQKWGDARLVCIRTKNVTPGSRVPSAPLANSTVINDPFDTKKNAASSGVQASSVLALLLAVAAVLLV